MNERPIFYASGMKFQRTDTGVKISMDIRGGGEIGNYEESREIDLNSWASAFASTTPQGENQDTFHWAENILLYGRPHTPTHI